MELPISALLYKITSMCDYDLQNVSLSRTYAGIHLYDQALAKTDHQRYLFFLTEDILKQQAAYLNETSDQDQNLYLCYSQQDPAHLKALVKAVQIVYLIPKQGETYPVVFNHLLNIFQSFHSWNQTFHIELLHGASMSKLLDITEPILSHPMVVLDVNMGLMGYARKQGETDAYMEKLIDTGYMTPDMYKEFQQLGLLPSDIYKNPLHISSYTGADGATYYSMCYQLRSENHLNSYVLVFCCNSHPSNSYQYLMDMVSDNLALYFQQSKAATSQDSDQYELFLTKLLIQPNQPVHRLESTLELIDGLTLHGYFTLAKAYFKDNENVSKSFIVWMLRNAFPELKPFIYEDAIYILRIGHSESDVLNPFLSAEAEKTFAKSIGDYLDYCIISNPFYILTDLSVAVKQCDAVYDYTYKHTKKTPFVYYREHAYDYMKHQLDNHLEPSMINSPYYQILKQYDQKNDTHLATIMYEYLVHFKSINETAEYLNLHRNTIQNNIKKAYQILDNTLDHFDDALFYIINYRGDGARHS